MFFFAIDKVGKNIFCDNICGDMTVSRSEEDFWSTFNLYDMKSSSVDVGVGKCEDRVTWTEGRGEPAVFNAEVLLLFLNLIFCLFEYLFVLLTEGQHRPGNQIKI